MAAPVFKVRLYIYDLSMGMARQLSPGLLGREIAAIYHTGIAVYNREFFYGGGIQEASEPNPMWTSQPGMQHQIMELGETSKTPAEFRAFLSSINHQFSQATYDLLNNNCNNFTDECAKYLLGRGIPENITGLPGEFLSTPIGMMLRPMIEQFQAQMTGGGASLDPFGAAQAPQTQGQRLGGPPNAASAAPVANPWANLAPQPTQPLPAQPAATASHPHQQLVGLTFQSTYKKPLLSSDANQGALLERVLAASAKLSSPQRILEQEVAVVRAGISDPTSSGFSPCIDVLCSVHERWDGAQTAPLLWLLRWAVTQEAGNCVVARHPSMLRTLLSRLPGLPATGRMMGLAMLANMSAFSAGKAAMTVQGVQDSVIDVCLTSLESTEALERRTAAALLYNHALESTGRMNELISVQLVCGLFAQINSEADTETRTRLLAALAHTMFCNNHATEAAANFGFALDDMEDPRLQTLVQEIRNLYL